jgi:hypothetical protein
MGIGAATLDISGCRRSGTDYDVKSHLHAALLWEFSTPREQQSSISSDESQYSIHKHVSGTRLVTFVTDHQCTTVYKLHGHPLLNVVILEA